MYSIEIYLSFIHNNLANWAPVVYIVSRWCIYARHGFSGSERRDQ